MKFFRYILAVIAWTLTCLLSLVVKAGATSETKPKKPKKSKLHGSDGGGCDRHDDPRICEMWAKMYNRFMVLDAVSKKFVKKDSKLMEKWPSLDLAGKKQGMDKSYDHIVKWADALLKAIKLYEKLKHKAVETENCDDLVKLGDLLTYLTRHRDQIHTIKMVKEMLRDSLEKEDEDDPFKTTDIDDHVKSDIDDLLSDLGLN